MKKASTIILAGALAVTLTGCGGTTSSSSSSSDTSSSESVIETVEDVDLDNLSIGDSAVFKNYTITVNAVEVVDGAVTATVTMDAKTKSTFAVRYMDAITTTGKKISAEHQSDQTVDAGESYTATIVYQEPGITTLAWDNWSNEAEWHFDPIIDGVSAEQSSSSSSDYFVSDAWAAMERYGDQLYPYGFKLNMITGMLAEDQIDENTWFLKSYCQIKNEYGTWLKNQNAEAYVTWNGSTWVVDSFYVY